MELLDLIFKSLKDPESERLNGRLLFYGIGNVGRQDDGLGIRLIENLESVATSENIQFQSNYQLNVEDALDISTFDVVIFVDATVEPQAIAPFDLREIKPAAEIAFSTHAMSLEGILALSDQFYGKVPRAFVLTLPGYHWEIIDELSPEAHINLAKTTTVLKEKLTGLQ